MPELRARSLRDLNIYVTLNVLRDAGVTQDEAVAVVRTGLARMAADGKWCPSELAVTVADYVRIAREVWK